MSTSQPVGEKTTLIKVIVKVQTNVKVSKMNAETFYFALSSQTVKNHRPKEKFYSVLSL